MAYLRPGVYVEEISPAAPPLTSSTADSIAAFIGATDKGPSTPTLVTSWSQYTSTYGTWGTNNDVTTAIYLFFANGGSLAYVQRVTAGSPVSANTTLTESVTPAIALGTQTPTGTTNITITTGAAHGYSVGQSVTISGVTPTGYNGTWTTQAGTTASTLVVNIGSNPGAITVAGVVKASTLKVSAKNVGTWGNNIYVGIEASAVSTDYFTLVVYSGGVTGEYAVERFPDITMKTTDNAYALTSINGSSNYIVAEDLLTSDAFTAADNPAAGAPVALTSGSNGTAPTTANIAAGVTGFNVIDNALLLNAPGLTAQADVDALLAYAAGRTDVFVIIDGKDDTAANQITLVNTYAATNASYGAVYFPRLVIPNPNVTTPGATLTVAPGAAVMGQIVTTDAARGVFKSPAGLETRLSGAVSVAKLTNSELDSLNSNSAAVNAIRYIPGSGIVVMGARTLKPGYASRYISVRRSIIYLRKQLSSLSNFALFEPNDFRLWNKLDSTIRSFLTDFWQQGGLVGASPNDAFFVKCDSDNNTALTIANGQVVIEVGVALQRPAEFIVIRISQYDGGAVVTIS